MDEMFIEIANDRVWLTCRTHGSVWSWPCAPGTVIPMDTILLQIDNHWRKQHPKT